MNTDSFPNGTTRRSFIKRSVVAAVAVSSMSIFSGLVHAVTPGATGTETNNAIITICTTNLMIEKTTCCTNLGKGVTKCRNKRTNEVGWCASNTEVPLTKKEGDVVKTATGCADKTGPPTYS